MKSNPSVAHRFQGRTGKTRLSETLLSQPILSGEVGATKAICKKLALVTHNSGSAILSQGAPDNDLYFILSGSVRIVVNGRQVAIRRANEHVGEMALLDRTAVRSATAITEETTVLGRISEPEFTKIANQYPILWRRIAVTIAQRLRERNRFHTVPRVVPTVFVGSSAESKAVAGVIHKSLCRRRIDSHLWSDGVFQASRATIEDLMSLSTQSDFAVLVLSADDITISRGKKKPSPRDNTVFELGLFMGALSRDRTYVVAPHPLDIKLPTDLLGVTVLTYRVRRGKSLGSMLRPVTIELTRLIERHGSK